MAEYLLRRGVTVYALVRNPSQLRGLQGLPVRVLEGDLLSIPALPKDLDAVIHLAALTKARKPEAYYSVNHIGTASLLRAVAEQGLRPRLIYVSSIAAGGPSSLGRPRREDDPAAPVSHYGRSKRLGEEEFLKLKSRFPVLILRAGAVYGQRDTDFLDYFKITAKGLVLTPARTEAQVSLVYIKDFIRALDLSLKKKVRSGEIINIASPRPTGWSELGCLAASLLGKKPRRLSVPAPLLFAAALCSEATVRLTGRSNALTLNKYREMREGPWWADTSKAKKLLGFETRYSLEQGLSETLSWYRENRWL